MEPVSHVTAVAAPLDRRDIDTDAIIPQQFLAKRGPELAAGLFHDWRYVDGDRSAPDPGFVLNAPCFRDAGVLVVGANFGCGSSREQAVWALLAHGIRAIVSTGFADIFRANAVRNGLIPVVLGAVEHRRVMAAAEARCGATVTVDVPRRTLATSDGFACSFALDEQAARRLVEGLDDISLTRSHEAAIVEFERDATVRAPWLDRATRRPDS